MTISGVPQVKASWRLRGSKKQVGIPAINLYDSVAYIKPHHVACSMEAGEIQS